MSRLLDPLALAALDAALRWTLPFALVWLVARALPLSAAARHHLWRWLLAGLLVLPMASGRLPEWRLRRPAALRSAEVALATLPAPAPAASPLAAAGARELPARQAPVRRAAHAGPRGEPPAFLPAGTARALRWLWAVVAAGLLAAWGLGQVAARRLADAAGPPPDFLAALLRECAGRLGIRRRVRLLIAADEIVPLTWGTLRPTIVLPAAALAWRHDRLRRVLLHEAAHVVRLDSLSHALSRFACAVFWFHPGVWHAARALRREAESACDDRVVAAGASTVEYAGDLLELSRALRPGALPGVALPMAQAGGLGRRVRRLLDPRQRRGLSRGTAVTLLLLPAAGLLVAAGLRWARGPDGGDWLRPAPAAGGGAAWVMDCGEDADPVCGDATRRALGLLERAGRPGVIVAQRVATGEVVTYAAVRPSGTRRSDAVPLVPPGSVAKLALAALWWESGMGDGPIPCPGSTALASGRTISNAGAQGFGELRGPHEMLVRSCNTAAAHMAGDLERRLGGGALARDLAALGFGAPGIASGSDADASFWARAAGDLPAAWSVPRPRLDGAEPAEQDALVTAVLGAGKGGTTPLHLSRFLQAIGNDGVMLPPRTAGWTGGSPGGVRLLGEETAVRLRNAMLDVVREGTAARTLPQLEWSRWTLGGKTGTVPGAEGRLDGSFAGLAHAPDGRAVYTVVVLVEGGGVGGGVPAGIAAEMTRLFARATGDEL